MKRFLLMLICLAGIISTYGQSGVRQAVIEVTKVNRSCIFTNSRIVTKVQILGFPEGDTSYRSNLENRLKASMASIIIPKRAKKGKYTAVVIFIITKDGSLAEVHCKNDPGYRICEEATLIIKKSKNWVPAKQFPR